MARLAHPVKNKIQTISQEFTAWKRDASTFNQKALSDQMTSIVMRLGLAQTTKNLPAMQETQVRSPGEGNGNPLHSRLENSMDRETWRDTVHGVAKSWTRLSDSHFHFHFTSRVLPCRGRCIDKVIHVIK